MSNINIIETLATSEQGLSVQAYKRLEGWSKEHVYQRAVIDKSHEHYAELVSLGDKVKKSKDTVELLFNAWLEGNQHLNASLGHDKNGWVNKIAHDAYESVDWSDIIDVGHRKAIRSMFKSFAKNECSKVYRLYKQKQQELRDKINERAIKFIDAHVSNEVAKLWEQIHQHLGHAFDESHIVAEEVKGLRHNNCGNHIDYAILHRDFNLNLDEVSEREERSKDKVASNIMVLSVAYEGDGRHNYSSGDRDSHIRQVSLGHIKQFDENGNNVRYYVEEDSINIRSGSSDARFSTKDINQMVRIKLLITAVCNLMHVKHDSVWCRQDWMNEVHISE